MRPEEVYKFCCDLTQMCNATGMSVNPRPIVGIRSVTPNNVENALKDVHRRTSEMLAKQGKGGQLQLLLVILPEFSGSTYGTIKRVCKTELEIVSECCLPWHASRPKKQYLEYVANKINRKAGEYNTVFEKSSVRNGIPFLPESPRTIFDADVTRPQPGEDSASSTVAVVASMGVPEITKHSGLLSAQPHMQQIVQDRNVIKDQHKVPAINLEDDVAEPKIVKETPTESFQAHIRVLDFKPITLMVQSNWTVQRLVSESFLKCGGVYFHPRVIINSCREAGLADILSDFVEGQYMTVNITSRLLGGAHFYLDSDVALFEYILSFRTTLFDVCTIPDTSGSDTIHFPKMHPYFVSLGPPAIDITRQILDLVLNRDSCLGPLDVNSFSYSRTQRRLYLHADVAVLPFTQNLHYQNLYDVGTILSQNFLYDENLLLSSALSIHVTGPNPAESWRLPPFVDLLVYDLQTAVRQFLPFNILKNKSHFKTHIGHMFPAQRVKYLLCQELDTDYKGGENYLEKVVGLVGLRSAHPPAVNPFTIRSWENAASKALPFKSMFPEAQLPQNNPPAQLPQNNPPAHLPQNNPPAQLPRSNPPAQIRRAYNFTRIGALWSCGRNFVGHAKRHTGCKISLKQAEAYLNLVFPGLSYHVRLRTRFKRVAVAFWHRSPKRIRPYRGPRTAAAAIHAAWCKNKFDDEEVLGL